MLREDHLISVIGPTGTGPPKVVGTKPVAEAAVGPGVSDVVNKAAPADQVCRPVRTPVVGR
jgi:hypothetical protein